MGLWAVSIVRPLTLNAEVPSKSQSWPQVQRGSYTQTASRGRLGLEDAGGLKCGMTARQPVWALPWPCSVPPGSSWDSSSITVSASQGSCTASNKTQVRLAYAEKDFYLGLNQREESGTGFW